ncbi:hypothetical protein C2845_PM02G13070 [Panicum miliaceum]|uniref:Uncharacterized protein n=1 Tax=Panicum miliaceum TaxID=4540 RepID=A0A3L6S5K3_PANMI|nr:hypothetical protein C2845_PM02G13070 [Panicum miliaceum]
MAHGPKLLPYPSLSLHSLIYKPRQPATNPTDRHTVYPTKKRKEDLAKFSSSSRYSSFPIRKSRHPPSKEQGQNKHISIVDMSETIYNREQKLQNALIATSFDRAAPTPSIQDIYLAIQSKHGPSGKPAEISSFPPDFILHFANKYQKETVLAQKTIEGPNFSLTLCQWTNEYRSEIMEWNTHVSLEIKGIPPHLFLYDCLKPLILPHCGIRTANFDSTSSICKVNAYTKNMQSIPTKGRLGTSYHHFHGVTTPTFPITLTTTPYTEPEQNLPSQWAHDPSADVDLEETSSHFDPAQKEYEDWLNNPAKTTIGQSDSSSSDNADNHGDYYAYGTEYNKLSNICNLPSLLYIAY